MIDFPPDGGPPRVDGPTRIEFVGGPRDGQRDELVEAPPVIEAVGGTYRRSVSCADDGALRYVFEAGMSGSRRDRRRGQRASGG